jgi:hypothetical protein
MRNECAAGFSRPSGHLQGVSKNVPVRLMGPGSKQEIALVNLVPWSLQGHFVNPVDAPLGCGCRRLAYTDSGPGQWKTELPKRHDHPLESSLLITFMIESYG